MGGNFRWNELSKIADVFQGTRLGRQPRGTGATPAMQGRDLSITDLTVNDLAMVSVPSDLPNPVYSEVGDILIQRIGQRPHAFLVEDELKGVLVKDTVYVVRLHHKDPLTAQYLIEFLNSDIGQALLSTLVGGAVIPTLRLTDLRRLRLPIPEKAVIELINDLHEVEQALSDRINHTRNLRRRLFSIKDPEQVEGQLRTLSTEAQVLAASLMQVDDLDFQIRNFYPFPLAYAHRALNAITEPSQRYQEQLRVAENILAFLASIGLAFVAYMQALSTPEKSNLTENSLSDCWKGGISPGSWQDIAYHSGSSLRGNRAVAAVNSFASIWFRGSGRRASRFTELTQQIVRIKNDHKHDRGPKTPQEYKEAVRSMDKHLRQCLEPLAFFVQYPIRLVRRIDIDWRTGQCLLNTLVYAGDHPGLRQERAVLSEPLPCDKLYLELGTDQWMPLYPVISVEYCPSCKAHETYFIDRWDGSEQYVELKSFERGHTHQNNDTAKRVGSDLEHWLREHFSKN
jgi:hypothetical protein